MAEVVLLHHAHGLTPGVRDFAERITAAGHTVHVPDLYDGRVFAGLEEGLAYAREAGFDTILERGRAAADALPVAVDVQFRDDCVARPEKAALVADLTRFVTMVETHTGKPVLLRIGKSVEGSYALSAALPRPVWAMANLLKPDYAARPWRMWRASNFRRVEGIEGPVNWDVVAG